MSPHEAACFRGAVAFDEAKQGVRPRPGFSTSNVCSLPDGSDSLEASAFSPFLAQATRAFLDQARGSCGMRAAGVPFRVLKGKTWR
jgi:hypothetical protein